MPADLNNPIWDRICFETRNRMAGYVWPFTTPISRSEDLENGLAWGTGNYVDIDGEVHVLTNEHIARKAREQHLAHLPVPGGDYIRFENDFDCWPWPADVALTRLGPHGRPSAAKVLRREHFADRFDTEEHELLFWLGYPGTTAKRNDPITLGAVRVSYFGELVSPAVPVLAQEHAEWPSTVHPDYVRGKHRLIHYPRLARTTLNAEPSEVPNPAGMSGSLLWDTKRLYCDRRRLEWSPDLAKVCAIIWATGLDPDIVVATPVEVVLASIDAHRT
jgi:hypothetical protein